MYKKLSESWSFVISQPMLQGLVLALIWPWPSKLPVFKQNNKTQYWKWNHLMCKIKEYFTFFAYSQVPPSNIVLQHRVVTYHLKKLCSIPKIILETCKLLNYSASCKGTWHPQRMFTATDVRNFCQGTWYLNLWSQILYKKLIKCWPTPLCQYNKHIKSKNDTHCRWFQIDTVTPNTTFPARTTNNYAVIRRWCMPRDVTLHHSICTCQITFPSSLPPTHSLMWWLNEHTHCYRAWILALRVIRHKGILGLQFF